MGKIKEVAEDITAIVKAADKTRAWTSRSTPKVLLIFALVGVFIVGVQALFLSWMVQKSISGTQVYIQDTSLATDKLGYEAAIDAITACLESRGETKELHTWYCDHADLQFRQRTEQLEYPGARSIFEMRAYLAMRDLIRSRVRNLESKQLVIPPNTSNEKILSVLVGKVGMIVNLVITALLLVGIIAYLVSPQRRRDDADA